HIKKNSLILKNRGNGSGNGVAQRRVYALGGRDASPDSNVITEPGLEYYDQEWVEIGSFLFVRLEMRSRGFKASILCLINSLGSS
nr:hypothetical protein [Tanacetum cinerariifolium]